MEICKKEYCTACGACAYVCPKQCIRMEEDELGNIYPIINNSVCVNCRKCVKTCPQNYPLENRLPYKAYAAWSTDDETRRTSASGGIAAELYREACELGYYVVGASMDKQFTTRLRLVSSFSECADFKNSKYVFCEPYGVYEDIRTALAAGQSVLVVGLPCQIAAVRSLFPNEDNLLLVDLVCHGVTPTAYLKQHVDQISEETSSRIDRISFRDPELDTKKFYFSAYNIHGVRIYGRRLMHGDTYNFGYHRAVSYRENCYHCQYARGERVSDITLSDYHGLGKLLPCNFGEEKVSAVLIHTVKGEEMVRGLLHKGTIYAEERPIEEPIRGDVQLQKPSQKSYARYVFEKQIKKHQGNFEKAIRVVMRVEKLRGYLRKIARVPQKMVQIVKK